jgi:hypothetical protein
VNTVFDIEYSEEIVSKLCNTCSGPCPDKYIEDIHYSDYRLKHNGQIIEDFSIALFK